MAAFKVLNSRFQLMILKSVPYRMMNIRWLIRIWNKFQMPLHLQGIFFIYTSTVKYKCKSWTDSEYLLSLWLPIKSLSITNIDKKERINSLEKLIIFPGMHQNMIIWMNCLKKYLTIWWHFTIVHRHEKPLGIPCCFQSFLAMGLNCKTMVSL